MNYKVYIVKTDDVTKVVSFIEADFNWGCGCETIDEALELIKKCGDECVSYTVLPYIYNVY